MINEGKMRTNQTTDAQNIQNRYYKSQRTFGRSSLGAVKPTFPGIDPTRDLKLKQFLDQPIDSRVPLEDEPEVKIVHQIPNRSNEPSQEIKQEWESRLNRIKKRSESNDELLCIYPSLVEREQMRESTAVNPLNVLDVESVQDARNLKVFGPMNQRPKNRLPQWRYLAPSIIKPSNRRRKTSFF